MRRPELKWAADRTGATRMGALLGETVADERRGAQRGMVRDARTGDVSIEGSIWPGDRVLKQLVLPGKAMLNAGLIEWDGTAHRA